ncbi:MAG: RNA polymerase sigma factor [Sedimentisphaeraceae bacterium JB056]
MLEDKLLVLKLKRGDKDALRTVYEKYRDDLLRIAANLLRERIHAEDVVHDVFASFATVCRTFTLTGSLKGYLITCVANRARNINRRIYRQQVANIDDVEPAASNIKRPDEWIIYNEQFRQIADAMSQLPYEQREVIALHINGAMKFKDIAKLQDVSAKTVSSRYRYGIDKLRSILNSEVKR